VDRRGRDSLAARDVTRAGAALAFARTVADRHGHAARIAHQLALTPAPHSYAAYRSESATPVLPPQFELTPFFDRWSGRLENVLRLEGLTETGLVFLALHRHVTIAPRKTVKVDVTMTIGLAIKSGLTDATVWRRWPRSLGDPISPRSRLSLLRSLPRALLVVPLVRAEAACARAGCAELSPPRGD